MHLFLDIETLDTRPSAVVTEIAYATFTDSFEILACDEFGLDPWHQLAAGRTYSADTLRFHQKHDTLPTSRGNTPAAIALTSLADVAQATPGTLWAWGSDFDFPTLADLARTESIDLPWKYWQVRDARTVWKLAFGTQRPAPRTHRAADDVAASIADLESAFASLDLTSIA